MKNSIRNTFPHSLLFVAGAMLLTAGYAAVAEAKPVMRMKQAAGAQSKMLSEAEKKSAEAEVLRKQQKYAAADAILQAQLTRLTPQKGEDFGKDVEARRQKMQEEIRTLHREWGNSVMQKARLAVGEKRYSDALTLAAEAAVIDPALKATEKSFSHGVMLLYAEYVAAEEAKKKEAEKKAAEMRRKKAEEAARKAAEEKRLAEKAKMDMLMKQAEVTQRKMISEVDKKSAEAETLRRKRDYAAADAILQAQLKRLTPQKGEIWSKNAEARRQKMQEEIRTLHREWGNVVMQKARLAAGEKRYSDALTLAAEAAVIDPTLKPTEKSFAYGVMLLSAEYVAAEEAKKKEAEKKAAEMRRKKAKEEKRLAAEAKKKAKEEKRIAEEKAAEEKRLAAEAKRKAEEAARKAAEEKILAEKAKRDMLMKQAVAVRNKMLAEVEKKSAEAETLRQKQDYAAADEILQAQLKLLTPRKGHSLGEVVDARRKEMQDEIRSLHREWGNAVMHKARLAAGEKRYSDAIILAAEAAVIDPALASSAKSFSEKCNLRSKGEDFRKETDIKLFEPDYESDKAAIDTYMREARTFYANKRYEDARTVLEKVFVIDPFNSEAASFLSKVYTQLYTYGKSRHEADVAGMLSVAGWNWVEPLLPAGDEDSGSEAQGAEVAPVASPDSIYNKLETITIREFTVDNLNISKAVRYLDTEVRNSGVRIGLAIDSNMAKSINITMSFRNIPLRDLLRYFCLETGLKMRVDGSNVILGTTDAPPRHESFRADNNLIANIIEGDGGASAEGGEGGNSEESTLGKIGEGKNLADSADENKGSTVSNVKVTSAKLKAYFEARGVSFGKDTSIVYDRRSGRLNVKNTADNLRRMRELIRQLDTVKSQLVMVEVKMIEILENDWQELGFQWRFNMYDNRPSSNPDWSMTQSSGWNPVGGASFDKSLAVPAENSHYLVQNLNLLPEFGNGLIKGVNMNVDLSISALCRNDRTETLYAPKLVAASGTEASIKMTKQYYYPDSWEAPEIDDGTFSGPVPEWTDDPTDIGVIFRVTPTVEDADIISLDLHPEVVSFVGRTEDSVTLEQGSINPDGSLSALQTQTYSVWMPIIGRRKADLVAKVQDGETIVIGGMIDNKTVTIRDRWPILGDIPLLGRLFSGESETVQKRNMIIFVTARRLSNKGVPSSGNRNHGMPDFNR